MSTLALSAGNRNELRKLFMLTLGVILMFSPSYIADLTMRRLQMDIGAAAGISLVLFVIGIFLVIRNTND